MRLHNNGRLYRFPRGAEKSWPTGEERDVTDDLAAKLLTSGHFSVVDPPLVRAPVAVAPVKKAAPRPKPKRRPRKKA